MPPEIHSEEINIQLLFETPSNVEVTSVEKFQTLKPKTLAHFDRILDRFEASLFLLAVNLLNYHWILINFFKLDINSSRFDIDSFNDSNLYFPNRI